tara:strand:+ start:125 stop:301 length:177 start_codon:yes stop_codon:yes gene_type:complete
MGIVDLGSVVRLSTGDVGVVIGIIHGAPLGMFYTVLVGDVVKEISESEIVKIVNLESG